MLNISLAVLKLFSITTFPIPMVSVVGPVATRVRKSQQEENIAYVIQVLGHITS